VPAAGPGVSPGATPAASPPYYASGIDDVFIWPFVAIGVVAKYLVKWTWSLLVHIVDYLFPIFLQITRFLLFTIRILGDAITGLLRLVIRILPLPSMKRQSWREAVARGWAWLRAKISYRAFEEWLHHLFEDGMAWTFRVCRRLSPTGALVVIIGALFWIPVSFLAGTAAHAWLIAEAHNLPPWMQLLHGLAALIPKTKLLMLPAYPAAWPQAKLHPIVQAGLRACRYVANLRLVRKTLHRFGQAEAAAKDAAHRWGLVRAWIALRAAGDAVLTRIGNAIRVCASWLAHRFEKLPVVGPVFRTYAEHYDRDAGAPSLRLSERLKQFFKKWEIKFTPAYYEAKDAEKKAAAAAAAQTAGSAKAP